MTIEEIKKEIEETISLNTKPKEWRNGQFVFNIIDRIYGVARIAQFKYGIDCFYNDDNIDKFINACSQIIFNLQNEQSN